jgi:hypothetical protein
MLFATAALAAPMPRRWHAPRWWLREAVCIHDHEGAWNDETGNGYSGGMQFLPSTWASVGGMGRPSAASPREQLYRAYLVWDRDAGKPHDGKGSWREWGTAGICGLA